MLATDARESRGRGAAQATIESTLVAQNGGTRVDIVTDLTLTGPVAQYGRGMVQSVAGQLTSQFASCLQKQLAPAPRRRRRSTVCAGSRAGGKAGLRPAARFPRVHRRHHRPVSEEEAMRQITVTVNGEQHEAEVEPRQLLVYFLREQLGLTGTNVGCDTSTCGACTVLLDGRSVKSCTVLAVQADGAEVATIEGLATDGELHTLQRLFHEKHGLQCGYCTPGMIMAALGLIQEHGVLDDATIRAGLEGNLCRCTGYQNIVAAVRDASLELAGAKS